jgi:hypothetical protein
MNRNILPQRIRPWRPVILIVLVILLLGFCILSWLRFGLALENGAFYNQVSGLPLSVYMAVSGAVWGIVSLAAAIGDWFRKPWALILTGVGAVVFTIWFWVERLALSRTSLVKTNWLFDGIFNLVILAFILTTVFAVYPCPVERPLKGKRNVSGKSGK